MDRPDRLGLTGDRPAGASRTGNHPADVGGVVLRSVCGPTLASGIVIAARRSGRTVVWVISGATAAEVVAATTGHWSAQLAAGSLTAALTGKEAGHALAPLVEVGTSRMLAGRFEVHEAVDPAGAPVVRDMADLWLTEDGVIHPVNVKCRVNRPGGQPGRPNMVSLVRLVNALAEGTVDAYYILVVTFEADGSAVDVRFGDLLSHVDCLAFDAGTGQLMARPALFEQLPAGSPSPVDVPHVLGQLLGLYESGLERLFRNRAETLERLRAKVASAVRPAPPGCAPPDDGIQLSLLY